MTQPTAARSKTLRGQPRQGRLRAVLQLALRAQTEALRPRSTLPLLSTAHHGHGILALAALLTILAGLRPAAAQEIPPWRAAGLSDREAAAHLLDRFAYGARPGEVERVVAMGLEAWFEAQLAGDRPDPVVAELLEPLKSLRLGSREIARTYPNPGLVLIQAREAGVLPEDFDPRGGGEGSEQDRRALRDKVLEFARQQGYRSQRELLGELMAQKLYRACYSENQLHEVLTDFWFNHFNVSLTDNQARAFVPSYERDAIRPRLAGRFRDLLGATAKHPAMLLYLDNAQSSAAADASTTLEREMRGMGRRGGRAGIGPGRRGGIDRPGQRRPDGGQRQRGLNENYARELLELHTLGVDGGYDQKDVVEVARAFTGWTVLPPGRFREMAEARLERVRRAGGLGFVAEGDFLFRADMHDAGKKSILGKTLPAGRGIEDGEEVLDLVAAHPSTARFIGRKLAARFVSDQPPEALVTRLAGTFRETGGDLAQVLRTLFHSPELWRAEARRQKIKSPFELAVSALRALDADLEDPRGVLAEIFRMGQPLYAYQAPTGFPDRAEAWVNTGSLLSRMNFGLQLAARRVPGVSFDLAALNGHREPESQEDALATYLALLLPARPTAETFELLGPVVRDPELARKVDEAAPAERDGDYFDATETRAERLFFGGEAGGPRARRAGRDLPPPTPLEQVVGVILGSPEFQRR